MTRLQEYRRCIRGYYRHHASLEDPLSRGFTRSSFALHSPSVCLFISLVHRPCDSARELLSREVFLKEAKDAIDAFPTSKTPGPDDFTYNLYKQHKTSVSPFLLLFFNFSYPSDILRLCIYTNHTLLLQETSNPQYIQLFEGYHQVTLCNVN